MYVLTIRQIAVPTCAIPIGNSCSVLGTYMGIKKPLVFFHKGAIYNRNSHEKKTHLITVTIVFVYIFNDFNKS